MRFLLHGQLGDGLADALGELGHATARLAEFNVLEAAPPTEVLQICRVQQHELLTASRDLVDAVLPAGDRRDLFGRVMVYLRDPPGQHVDSIRRLFERYKRLTPGRLYTVTGERVKVRQLPSGPNKSLTVGN